MRYFKYLPELVIGCCKTQKNAKEESLDGKCLVRHLSLNDANYLGTPQQIYIQKLF